MQQHYDGAEAKKLQAEAEAEAAAAAEREAKEEAEAKAAEVEAEAEKVSETESEPPSAEEQPEEQPEPAPPAVVKKAPSSSWFSKLSIPAASTTEKAIDNVKNLEEEPDEEEEEDTKADAAAKEPEEKPEAESEVDSESEVEGSAGDKVVLMSAEQKAAFIKTEEFAKLSQALTPPAYCAVAVNGDKGEPMVGKVAKGLPSAKAAAKIAEIMAGA